MRNDVPPVFSFSSSTSTLLYCRISLLFLVRLSTTGLIWRSCLRDTWSVRSRRSAWTYAELLHGRSLRDGLALGLGEVVGARSRHDGASERAGRQARAWARFWQTSEAEASVITQAVRIKARHEAAKTKRPGTATHQRAIIRESLRRAPRGVNKRTIGETRGRAWAWTRET